MDVNSARKLFSEQRLSWKQAVARYRNPELKRSLWQLVNTLVPYFAIWYLMIRSLEISYWLTLLLAVPAAGFLVRIFIIFHDCGHGSFFKSRKANDWVGFFMGALVFTPSHQWWHHHAVHHATAGDLDRRGVGDVWTMTVDEFDQASAWKRLIYRVYRHPIGMLTVAPVFMFVVLQRFPQKDDKRRARNSVYWTDLFWLCVLAAAHFTIGLKAFAQVQLPIIWIATSVGVWLFYIQHQFEGVYWERHEKWDFVSACLEGCSFYKLPKVIQWFTGNIGLHHIHHVRPRIPNYNLQRCYDEVAAMQAVEPLTLRKSLRSLRLHLWDESNQKLVGFRALRARPSAA